MEFVENWDAKLSWYGRICTVYIYMIHVWTYWKGTCTLNTHVLGYMQFCSLCFCFAKLKSQRFHRISSWYSTCGATNKSMKVFKRIIPGDPATVCTIFLLRHHQLSPTNWQSPSILDLSVSHCSIDSSSLSRNCGYWRRKPDRERFRGCWWCLNLLWIIWSVSVQNRVKTC